MAKDLSSATGIGTSADYLNGNLVPVVTVASVDINQDIVQFFQKLMSLAGLTANGDFDNEANDYQFIDALKLVNKYYKENYNGGATTQGAAGVTHLGKNDALKILSTGAVTMLSTLLTASGIIATTGDITASAGNIIASSGYVQSENTPNLSVQIQGTGVLNISRGYDIITTAKITKVSDGYYKIDSANTGSHPICIASVNDGSSAFCSTFWNTSTHQIEVKIYDDGGNFVAKEFSLVAYY